MRYYLCPDKADPQKHAWSPDVAAAHMFHTRHEAEALRTAGNVEDATGVSQGPLTWYVIKDEIAT
jgi:hypothetical protein